MTTALPMARKHPTFAKGESCCKSFSFKVSNAILLAKAKPKSLSLASLITRTITTPFQKASTNNASYKIETPKIVLSEISRRAYFDTKLVKKIFALYKSPSTNKFFLFTRLKGSIPKIFNSGSGNSKAALAKIFFYTK